MARWKDLLRRLMFWKRPVVEEKSRTPNPLTLQRQQIRGDAKENGAYLRFDDFLHDLDQKFALLDRTKFPKYRGYVPEGRLLQKWGAYIMAEDSLIYAEDSDTPPEFLSARPDIVLTSMPMDPDADSILGDWLYLVKAESRFLQNVEVCRPNEVLYGLNILVPKHGKRFPVQHYFCMAYFAVSREGVRELRYRTTDPATGRRRGWCYSPSDCHAMGYLNFMATTYAMRDRHWSVHAIDKKLRRVVATVPDNDAPRFFKKAESDGRRFHAVMAHTRKNGSNVRTHWRGNRVFRFRGYQISVNLPGYRSREISVA